MTKREKTLMQKYFALEKLDNGKISYTDIAMLINFNFPELIVEDNASDQFIYSAPYLEVDIEGWGKGYLIHYETKFSDEMLRNQFVSSFINKLIERSNFDLNVESNYDFSLRDNIVKTSHLEDGLFALRRWFDAIEFEEIKFNENFGTKNLEEIIQLLSQKTKAKNGRDTNWFGDFANVYAYD